MGINIRKAAPQDAPGWLELLRAVTEDDYADKQVYDPGWIATQLQESETETLPAIHYALARMGLTYKKRLSAPVSRTVRTSPKPTVPGTASNRASTRQS